MKEEMQVQVNEYKGFSLFNDVEDEELRTANRGTVLANIMESGRTGNKLSSSATADAIGYFASIPPQERQGAVVQLERVLGERGITATKEAVH